MDEFSIKYLVRGKERIFEGTLYGRNYLHLKKTFLQKIHNRCKLEKLSGEIMIEATSLKNGKWFDTDECWAVVSDDFKTINIDWDAA